MAAASHMACEHAVSTRGTYGRLAIRYDGNEIMEQNVDGCFGKVDRREG